MIVKTKGQINIAKFEGVKGLHNLRKKHQQQYIKQLNMAAKDIINSTKKSNQINIKIPSKQKLLLCLNLRLQVFKIITIKRKNIKRIDITQKLLRRVTSFMRTHLVIR